MAQYTCDGSIVSAGAFLLARFCWRVSAGSFLLARLCWLVSAVCFLLALFCWRTPVGAVLLGVSAERFSAGALFCWRAFLLKRFCHRFFVVGSFWSAGELF